jgi:hypothetical protein
MSASAYSLTVTVPAEGFEVARGEPVLGGLKGPVSHHFHCPDCLAWIFTRAEGFDGFVNLRASALDERRWFEPYVELWTDEKLPWAATGARHSYATAPDMSGWESLIAGFAAEGARPT